MAFLVDVYLFQVPDAAVHLLVEKLVLGKTEQLSKDLMRVQRGDMGETPQTGVGCGRPRTPRRIPLRDEAIQNVNDITWLRARRM